MNGDPRAGTRDIRYVAGFCVAVLLAALIAACSGSSGGDGSSASPTGPTATSDATDADFAHLAAQIAAVAADAVTQTLASSAATPASVGANISPRAVQGPPSTALIWNTQYFCCGSQANAASSVVRANGTMTVAGDGSGTVTVVETIEASSTLWTVGTAGSRFQIQIPPDGLKVTATLATAGGRFTAAQQFRLSGSLAYIGANNVQRTAAVDLVVNYTAFPNQSPSSQPPTATGRFGTAQINGTALPARDAPALVSPPTVTQGAPSPKTYTGTFAGQLPITLTIGAAGQQTRCTQTTALNGTATFILTLASSGAVTGSAQLNGTETFVTTPCSQGTSLSAPISWNLPVTGTATSFAFSGQSSATGGGVTVTTSLSFSGALTAGVVTGTATYGRTQGGTNVSGSASTTFPLSAR